MTTSPLSSFWLLVTLLAVLTSTVKSQGAAVTTAITDKEFKCDEDKISFEMVTGYVYSSPSDLLESQPGVLSVTECLDMCRSNSSCHSVNYETGLCVLFSSSADSNPSSLTVSDFPVFTLYVKKQCLEQAKLCERSWSFERVLGHELNNHSLKAETVASRTECQILCLNETSFPCRSANYKPDGGECSLSDMDRNTVVGTKSFQPAEGVEYLENNCQESPVRLCEFQRKDHRILKTVDSVYQNVKTLDECKNLCLQAPYRCRSFDHNDTGEDVCRLSHHTQATLTNIGDPYLEFNGSATYELSACYNVTLDCRSGELIVHIMTSKIFNGKVYAKGSPNTCVKDISNAMTFEIEMSYNNVDCNVNKESASRYSSDIVVQHHDTVVTAADMGLAVHCQYDLSNKSVSNKVDLQVTGDTKAALEEGSVVESPNVLMRITDREGDDIVAAAVGDMLQLRFEIVDPNSPYEIFVSNLTAVEGGGEGNQITLLDERGCPTELSIMRPMMKVDGSGKVLGASFDAFKFPTSEAVEFRATVTPCLPFCEPAVCNLLDFNGQNRQEESYGRKKRSIDGSSSPNMKYSDSQVLRWLSNNHVEIEGFGHTQGNSLVVRRKRETESKIPEKSILRQTIIITDKFGFKGGKKHPKKALDGQTLPSGDHQDVMEEELVLTEAISGGCVNTIGLVIGCSAFLVAQLILIVAWTAVWHRRRRNKLEEPLSASTTTESLRQLYDSGYPRRI